MGTEHRSDRGRNVSEEFLADRAKFVRLETLRLTRIAGAGHYSSTFSAAAMARSTRGCAFTGPGPINNLCGGSICLKRSGIVTLQSLDKAEHHLQGRISILRRHTFRRMMRDPACAAQKKHRRRT